jgi:hypothetical protein
MARDVMILLRATSITRTIGRGGLFWVLKWQRAKLVPFWAQKSRDFQGPPPPMALFCLRAMENCICGLRSIERNMRPNLRIEYLVYEVQAGSGVGGRGGQIMNSDQKVLPRQFICWLHSRPEYSGVYSRDMQ